MWSGLPHRSCGQWRSGRASGPLCLGGSVEPFSEHHIRCFVSSYVVHTAPLVKRKNIIYDDSSIESGDSRMAAKRKDWQAQVKGLLKAELKRRNLSYADLAEKLAAIGVKDNERNISNKISRGTFTAIFFVQCMEAIGCRTIHLEET